MRRRTLLIGVVSWLLAAVTAAPSSAQVDGELLAGMKARSIGPAGMSGRVAAIEAVTSNPDIIYVGAATGGVWKSLDGGVSWKPIFDDQEVAAIGAVAVFQPSPDIVWVGTGEGNPRNSVSVGYGIYKSMDAGRTWQHLGLEKTEHISRVLLHPENPDIAYVAALGQMWGENAERGVFKTVDGGKTWQKVLYVDPRTGTADLAMDPTNPNKLIAAMWDYQRWPWFFRSGGPGSGLYITVDGGSNWRKLTAEDGLPDGELGRIGLAIAPSNPSIVYALIEAEKENALYRSEDGGYTWREAGSGDNVGNRPFYFADIRVDPRDPNRVYSLWSRVSVSNDGGRTFQGLIGFGVHPDHHAMWISPEDPSLIYEGNDGGVYISRDRGETWKFVRNLPLAQYYHIDVDLETPYNIYGGMQDNGSWRGPSSVWENGGIRNFHWEEVGFGDGFRTLPIPSDPLTGYSMSQEGNLRYWDLRTGLRKDIQPVAPEDGVRLRFNWNAGIARDPFDPNTVYFGSQYLHKSTDHGENWEVISSDLTTDNPEWQKQAESGGLTLDVTGAENYTTIIAIGPSPVQQGVIWVGTDDGRLHVTRDGGASWTSVEGNLKGVPKNTWIPNVEPSKYDPATAFVVLDNHRRSDWTPYVYKTTDYGRSWRSLATRDIWGYALDIVQDPVDPDLLFLGTEFGLYISLNGGDRWMRWTQGFPTVSAMALEIHPRDQDLVIGTHGRAAYIIDDISPLRSITPEVLAEPIHLFEIPAAQQYEVKQTGASRFPADDEFRGENEPYGAMITYSLNVEGLPRPGEPATRARQARRRPGGPAGGAAGGGREERPRATIEVSDPAGKVIRTFREPATLGLNRVAWDLRRDGFKRPGRDQGESFFQRGGPEVLPGTYGVKVKYGDHEAEGSVEVLADPRFDIPREQRIAKQEAIMHAGALQELLAEAVGRIDATRSDIDAVLERARGDTTGEAGATDGGATDDGATAGAREELTKSGRELKKRLNEVEKQLWMPPGSVKGIPADTSAYSDVRSALFSLMSSWDSPTPAQGTLSRRAENKLDAVLSDFNRLYAEDVDAFRRQVEAAGIEFIEAAEPLNIPSRQTE